MKVIRLKISDLLKLVKEKEKVEGISVGSVLSYYQCVGVENVYKRLNLQLSTYLWQRNQDLFQEMITFRQSSSK